MIRLRGERALSAVMRGEKREEGGGNDSFPFLVSRYPRKRRTCGIDFEPPIVSKSATTRGREQRRYFEARRLFTFVSTLLPAA